MVSIHWTPLTTWSVYTAEQYAARNQWKGLLTYYVYTCLVVCMHLCVRALREKTRIMICLVTVAVWAWMFVMQYPSIEKPTQSIQLISKLFSNSVTHVLIFGDRVYLYKNIYKLHCYGKW